MISYEDLIKDLEKERGKLFGKLNKGNINPDLVRGAFIVLDKLIEKYENELEKEFNND